MMRFHSKGRLGQSKDNQKDRALFADRWEILVYKLLYKTDPAKAAAAPDTPRAPGDTTVSFRTDDYR